MATKSSSEKPDLRAQLAEELIKRVEQGTASWQKPWDPSMGDDTPVNAITGKPYRGINRELLSTFGPGDGDNRFCTYKQATEKGWQVRKGAHGFPIEKWSTYEKAVTDEKTGDQSVEQRMGVRYYTVFHASQIDGIPPLERPAVEKQIDPDQRIDAMLVSMGVSQDNGGNRAFYRVSPDHIRMPPVSAFPTAGDYDTVRLHEASHATGHPSRLNRDLSGQFGSPKYAKEELRAEISSAMTSRMLGVAFDPDQVKATEQSRVEGVTNSAAYLASWLRSLPEKDRTKELMAAISDAQKISDHLLSHVPELQVEQEHERPTVSRGDYVRYTDDTGKTREGVVLDDAAAGEATRVRGIYRWSNGMPGMDGADHIPPTVLPSTLVEHLPGAVKSGQTLDAVDPVTAAYKLTMGDNLERNKAEYAVLRSVEAARGVPDPHLMPMPQQQQAVDIQKGDYIAFRTSDGTVQEGIALRAWTDGDVVFQPTKRDRDEGDRAAVWPTDARIATVEKGAVLAHVPGVAGDITLTHLNTRSTEYQTASMADITRAAYALERNIDAAMPAEKFRALGLPAASLPAASLPAVSLQHEARIGKTREGLSAPDVVVIGIEPGQQRRWTGKVASVSEDRKTIEITAMGKTQSIVDARGRPFPAEIQPGQYGKVVLDKSGRLAFDGKEKTRGRSRGVAQ